MKKLLLALLLALAPLGAFAQSVSQSGTITVGQAARWVSNGIIGTGGTAADGLLTGLGITNNGLSSFCISSARATAVGRQQMCFGVRTTGASVISVQNYGTATAQDLQFNINGTTVTIPTGGGGTVPTLTLPVVANQPICANNTTGDLKGCSVGATNAIPYWTSSTVQGIISSAASSVLVTSSGSVPSLSTTLPSAVQANITATGTIASGVWNGTAVGIAFGGTGVSTLTANGVLIGNGTSALQFASTASVGLCLLSNGSGTAPSFQSCSAGAGSAGGSNTQIQYNSSSSLAGSANLTWSSPSLTIGVNASATGQLVLANGGALGTSVTIQNPSNTASYNFNLPASAGTSGQPMLSAAGGSSPMTFGTLGIGGGGTNCAAASGTCLDNITGFSSTGFINRTGASTYTFTSTIGLINGGTAANLTASNGGIVYSTASQLAILSGTATANQIVLSGASAAPTWSTATYPATVAVSTILYGSSSNVVGTLATANSGVLITSAGGVPSISSTIPSATQDNITRTGTITSGVWTGTSIALANGGTSAALTASNGGIFYSTASAGAILSGTATAGFPVLSGSSTTPTWATITYPGSATSGGILYFSSATAMASSAVLGAGAIVVGGGAGTTPASVAQATLSSGALSLGTNATALGSVKMFGNTSGDVTVKPAAAAGTATVFQLPATNGVSTQFLQTDGNGVTSWQSAAGGGTVTSITPGGGLTSTLTATAPGSAITASGTLSGAELVNAQTGTTYAIVDGDRAKLVTAFNAAAQAYSIAQAGNSSAFQAGWFVDVRNTSTNAAGIVTITPATSTIDGAATYVLSQGRAVRIVSDGTNYQIANTGGKTTLPTFCRIVATAAATCDNGTSQANAGTYTTPANALWVRIRMVGGGGGGGASATNAGSAGGNTCWNTTGAACTTPVYQATGGGGGGAGGSVGGAGGVGGTNAGSSTASISVTGGSGGAGSPDTGSPAGGLGGSSCLGGGGASGLKNTAGSAAAAYGSGGGGAGGSVGALNSAGGGGSGGCIEVLLTTPAATYTYAIGALGAGGSAGTNAGGNGAIGYITIEEHYAP